MSTLLFTLANAWNPYEEDQAERYWENRTEEDVEDARQWDREHPGYGACADQVYSEAQQNQPPFDFSTFIQDKGYTSPKTYFDDLYGLGNLQLVNGEIEQLILSGNRNETHYVMLKAPIKPEPVKTSIWQLLLISIVPGLVVTIIAHTIRQKWTSPHKLSFEDLSSIWAAQFIFILFILLFLMARKDRDITFENECSAQTDDGGLEATLSRAKFVIERERDGVLTEISHMCVSEPTYQIKQYMYQHPTEWGRFREVLRQNELWRNLAIESERETLSRESQECKSYRENKKRYDYEHGMHDVGSCVLIAAALSTLASLISHSKSLKYKN